MNNLNLFLIGVLAYASLTAGELNITVNEDGTFEASDYYNSMTRVINGKPSRATDFPWHVTVFTMRQANVWSFSSGALLSNRFVLAVASLVGSSHETRVSLGSNRFGQGRQVFSTQTVVHPRFRTGSRLFNIALIRLVNPVQINAAVRPIALPPNDLLNNHLDGQFVRFSGFGSTGKH